MDTEKELRKSEKAKNKKNLRLKILEEERVKLQLQQKALDTKSQLSIEEMEILQKEGVRKVVERVLFALGLVLATILVIGVVFPNFRIASSFFSFGKDKVVLYERGYVQIVDNDVHSSVLEMETYLKKIKNVSKDTLTEYEQDVAVSALSFVDDLGLIDLEFRETFDEMTHIEQMKYISKQLEGYRSHTIRKARMKANFLPFYVGYNPNDLGLRILYTINGIVFYILLIALLILYILTMGYGVKYFTQIIRGLITGAGSLVRETGMSVLTTVVQEGAGRDIDDITSKSKTAPKKKTETKAKTTKVKTGPKDVEKKPTKRRTVKKDEEPKKNDVKPKKTETIEIDGETLSEDRLNQILAGSITLSGEIPLGDDEQREKLFED